MSDMSDIIVQRKLETIERQLRHAVPDRCDPVPSAADMDHLISAVANLSDLVKGLLRDQGYEVSPSE
jgi:hypothetical protein